MSAIQISGTLSGTCGNPTRRSETRQQNLNKGWRTETAGWPQQCKVYLMVTYFPGEWMEKIPHVINLYLQTFIAFVYYYSVYYFVEGTKWPLSGQETCV